MVNWQNGKETQEISFWCVCIDQSNNETGGSIRFTTTVGLNLVRWWFVRFIHSLTHTHTHIDIQKTMEMPACLRFWYCCGTDSTTKNHQTPGSIMLMGMTTKKKTKYTHSHKCICMENGERTYEFSISTKHWIDANVQSHRREQLTFP